ncbi:uncharacterized protein LOC110407252 [Numida meleagris]|uniref:uncharacterized protein LOC110407252 n=1 Tax=Numida meleagris TaxID=8996 RepID=UPI000B3E198D|nr:uncharacterized protein LOC110407252 [Numida meleagris]XP_021270398.1 uncharacterized protein LOC110407252 [Numida meleagris]XP_021270399.1 uncharacterized protein LOC110407252 [Numida meleagris]XP_021270400.1 uncharacterized protein LOC110407252 [Numida meleagris]
MCIHPIRWPGERARLGATSSSDVPAQRGTQLGTAGSNPPSPVQHLPPGRIPHRGEVAGSRDVPPSVPALMTPAMAVLHKVCLCAPSSQVCCNNELKHKHAWALTHTHRSKEPWVRMPAAWGTLPVLHESVVPFSLAPCKCTSKPTCIGYGDPCSKTLRKNMPNAKKKPKKKKAKSDGSSLLLSHVPQIPQITRGHSNTWVGTKHPGACVRRCLSPIRKPTALSPGEAAAGSLQPTRGLEEGLLQSPLCFQNVGCLLPVGVCWNPNWRKALGIHPRNKRAFVQEEREDEAALVAATFISLLHLPKGTCQRHRDGRHMWVGART